MKKPFKICIEVYVMANSEEEAECIAEDIIDDSNIEENIHYPVWNDPEELDKSLGIFFSAKEISVDEVNELFKQK